MEPAQQELDEAVAWYDRQAANLGTQFLDETIKVFRLIDRSPQAWHPLNASIRRCRLGRFPYSVIYSVEDDDLIVIAVAHQHRKPNYWRKRL